MIDVLDLVGDRKLEAHSSIVLTYGLDLLLYDGYLRRQLFTAGAANQIVFCDANCYERELAAVASSRYLGRAYSVTPVHQAAAFHPKIYLLLGAERGRMVIGSGNATLGGLTRNGELFGVFEFDPRSDAGPHPAFRTAMALVRSLADKAPAPVRTQLDRAVSRSAWLQQPPVEDGRKLLIGGPGRPALLSQVLAEIGERSIDEVTVCSASFDRRLSAVERLTTLPGRPSVTCLVQPDEVALDGESVRRLGTTVNWREISLEHLRRKADQADTFSHAKLYVFASGDQEFVAYGSANASAPALLDGGEPNTEVLVLLPPMRRGTVADKLQLKASLDSASVYTRLCECSWPAEDERPADENLIRINGIAADHGRFTVSFAAEPPTRELRLALAPSPEGTDLIGSVALAQRDDGQWTGTWAGNADAARVGWIVDADGRRISNTVAVTWREVADRVSGSGQGRKVDEAIAAIQDGQLLSMALYSLLDHASDLPRSPSRAADDSAPLGRDDVVSDRPQASFYSDRVAIDGHVSSHLGAERMDLDLLAYLVQPLAVNTANDDGDWSRNEEDERRAIDEGDTQGEGTNAGASVDATVATIERKARSMARRLDRAARAAEDALGMPEVARSASELARQLWMIQVAGFLAGREVLATDGPAVCLAPEAFARYVLRLAHALVGGKAGGLLTRAPASIWEGHDGENMKRGLAFAWTCVAWAAAHTRRHWESVAEANEHPSSLAEAVPELVAARFVRFARTRCDAPDEADLSRRLPAVATLTADEKRAAAARLDRLVSALVGFDASPPDVFPPVPPRVEPGTLVYSAGCGLTVVAQAGEASVQLVDLSAGTRTAGRKGKGQDPDWLKTFRARVVILSGLDIPTTYWRPPRDLVQLSRGREKR